LTEVEQFRAFFNVVAAGTLLDAVTEWGTLYESRRFLTGWISAEFQAGALSIKF
jgi:hypothetical protein